MTMYCLLILAALLTGCSTPQSADEPTGRRTEYYRYTQAGRTPVWEGGAGLGLRR